jgi:gliding motility-associated-like protein
LANGQFTPANAGAGNATITYTYNNGCQTTDQHVISIITTIAVPITDLGPVCVTDAPFTFQSAVSGGTWSGTGITQASSGTFDPTTSGPGTFTITYNYNGTCTGTDVASIEVQAVPTPTIADPGVLCANQTIAALNATVAGGAWTGPGVVNATTGQYNPSQVGVGNYTVTYTIDDVCFAQTQRSLTVNPNPIVNAGSDVTICSYETATLTAIPGGWDAANWSNGSTGESITVSSAGNYTIEVTENGCSSTDAVIVSVNQMPVLDLGNTRNICEGSSEVITSGASGAVGSWSTGAYGNSITATQSGMYVLTYENGDCSVRDSVEVVVFESPQFDLGPDRTTCPDEPVVLSVPYQGVWNTGFTGGSLNITSSGTYSVSVSNGPCLVSDQIIVTILPAPIAYLKSEYVFCKGQQRTLSAYNPVNEGYMWNTGSDSTTIVVKEPGTYSVLAYNVCGTAEAATVVVEEDCTYSIYIPTSFTPNSDGINDFWKPVVYNLSEYEVSIFNRWGERIWHTTDTDDVWTGEVRDGAYYTQDGLYFYRIRFATDRQEAGEETGTIFILR